MANATDALDEAARDMPEGWEINVSVVRGHSDVELVTPIGDVLDFASNRESLAEEIRDAVAHALASNCSACGGKGEVPAPGDTMDCCARCDGTGVHED